MLDLIVMKVIKKLFTCLKWLPLKNIIIFFDINLEPTFLNNLISISKLYQSYILHYINDFK